MNANLTLTRTAQSDICTFGRVTRDADGSTLVPATLELPDRHNEHNVSRIPAGRYLCKRGNHPMHGECFEITGVPDRSSVLIHWGNYPRDTEGCVLVGKDVSADTANPAIESSKDEYALFMHDRSGIDAFWLTVVDVAA